MVVQGRIAQYLKEQGVKQRWLAEKTGISERKISDIMNGNRKLSADEFEKICRALGKEPSDFMVTD